jgi:LmbE family N-acetylglucosaminyl deacetylase
MSEKEVTRRSFLGTSAAVGTTLSLDAGAEPDKAKKTLLAVEAHMDDIEWGAAGLLFKAVKAGYRVVIVQAVSDYSNWPPTQGHEKEVEKGLARITKEMGVEKIYLGYKYHEVPVDLPLKRRIAEIVDAVKPDIALIQTESDYWTDHANIARAAKDGIMFAHGYLKKPVKKPTRLLAVHEAANQTYDFRPDTFVDITPVIDRVAWLMNELEALREPKGLKYTSNCTLYGPADQGFPKKMDLATYAEVLLAEARRWGEMCRCRYAEAFQSIQFVTSDLL